MWKKLNININMIAVDTGSAVLISMPRKSEYAGYQFWFPKKLVNRGRHSAAVTLTFKDDFVFHLRKFGNGKFNNHEVIDEIPIAADEMEEAFSTVNENIIAPKDIDIYETHKPEKLEAVETTADESLIDY